MLLSIVVNMYNTARYMSRCMDSLLHQDISADLYEVILVNDGSSDNSLEIAEDYLRISQERRMRGEMYPLIRVITHDNKGLAGARNTGVDAATGKFLCFVDPDDYIEHNSLAALLHQMVEDNLDVLRFNYQKIDEAYMPVMDEQQESQFDYSPGVISGIDFLANRLNVACYVWAYIYRLDLIRHNQIRFHEGCYFDDTPWLPRVLQHASRVACTSVKHQYYMQRAGSMVRTQSLDSIRRKIDGQMDLLSILQTQMQDASSVTYVWYRMMIAHTTISLLSTLSVHMYSFRQAYISHIRTLNILPLSYDRATSKSLRKIRFLNFSPQLFCVVIHLKSILTK